MDIEKLLKKKNLTGTELGRIAVANSSIAYYNALKKNTTKQTPIISSSEFQKKRETLDNSIEDVKIYRDYLKILDWASNTLQMANAQDQQAKYYLSELIHIANNATLAEQAYRYSKSLPYIITEKQYKELKECRIQETIKSNGESVSLNIVELILLALYYFNDLLIEHPRAKNPLKSLKEQLSKEPVESKYLIENYNKVAGRGYFLLKDGRRSDEMSKAEWDAFKKKIYKDGEGKGLHPIMGQSDFKRAFKESITDPNAFSKNYEEKINQMFDELCEWHYYDEPPKNLTKWQLLKETQLSYFFRYNDKRSPEEYTTLYRLIETEIPTVLEVVIKDMKERIPAFKTIDKLTIEDWIETTYTGEELYNIGFYGVREYVTSDENIFDGNDQALTHGIAIIRPTSNQSDRIDKEGNYKPPILGEDIEEASLDNFFPEHKDYTQNIRYSKFAMNTLIKSRYFVNGFNKALDIIASIYDLEEIKFLKIDTAWSDEEIKHYNRSTYLFHTTISHIYKDDEALRIKKLNALKNGIQEIDVSQFEIPESKIKEATEAMKDIDAFEERQKDPYLILCIYPADIKVE